MHDHMHTMEDACHTFRTKTAAMSDNATGEPVTEATRTHHAFVFKLPLVVSH